MFAGIEKDRDKRIDEPYNALYIPTTMAAIQM